MLMMKIIIISYTGSNTLANCKKIKIMSIGKVTFS